MSSTKGSTNTTPGGQTARPRLRWGGPPGTVKPETTPGTAIGRGLGGLLVLTNPVAAIATGLAVLLLTRGPVMARVRGWWLAAAGLGVMVATLRWTGPRYITPWVEARAVVEANGLKSGAALGRLAAEKWAEWVSDQLPLALLAGVTIGAVILARLARHQAHWRTNDDDTRNLWDTKTTRKPGTTTVKPLPEPKAGTRLADMVMRLGFSPAGKPVTLRGSELFSHIVVTGPTGRGKTTTLLRLLFTFIVSWRAALAPVVMFDMKADPAVREALRAWAKLTGRRFWHVSVTEDGDLYDALHDGTPEEIASRLVTMMSAAKDGGFSEPHHRTVGERWLIASMLVLDDLAGRGRKHPEESRKWQRSLPDLATIMRPAVMKVQATSVGDVAKQRAKRLLDEIDGDKDLGKSMGGMRSRIALMAETAAGRVLVPSPEALHLEAAVRAGDVVLFGLSAASNAAAAQVVGNLAVEDLAAIFDRLQHESWAQATGRRVFLVIDEFTGLGGEALQKLYERARSGGGTLVSSTQTSGGFKAVSPEFDASVWGNSDVWMLHKQEESIDAEERAKAIGTQRGWSETVQVYEDAGALGTTGGSTGTGSLRPTDRFRVHPNELKTMTKGQLVLWVKTGNRLERVSVEEVPGASTSRVLSAAERTHAVTAPTDDATATEPPADDTTGAAARASSTPAPRRAPKKATTPPVTPSTDTDHTEPAAATTPAPGQAEADGSAAGSWGWADEDHDDQGRWAG